MNLTVILVLLLTFNLSAAGFGEGKSNPIDNPQQVTVRGVITDATTGQAMPGVNIVVSRTTVGTISDPSGNYSLQVPSASVTLQFSFIGYVTQEIALNGRTTLNVALLSDIEQLSEVVVIGYGTARKSDLTGSITSVKANRLLDKPVNNVGQALTGKITGVQVVQQGGGIPGGNPMIRVRGTNSVSTTGDPLFVVDGIVGVANALQNLNPEDITSIDVLKDASSTAIYGARGANGVIIITTKRGISGKTQVEYKSYVTASVMNRHTYTMNAEQLMYTYEQSMANVEKYGIPNRGKDFRGPYATGNSYSEMPWLFIIDNNYPVKLLGKDGKYYAPRYDMNWEKEAYGTAISSNNYIDVRGGSENAKFSLAAGYANTEGLMIDSYYKRYNAKLTGDVKISKWLDVSTSLSFIRSVQTDDGGITRSTAEVWPIVPIKYPDDPATFGIYALRWGTNSDFNVGEQWYNIVFRRNQSYGLTYRNQVTGSVILNAQITKDLSFKSDFSTDFNNGKANSWSGTYFTSVNSATVNHNNSLYWQNQNYFNYQKTIGDHSLNGMLGLSWSRSTYENVGARNRYFFTDFYVWHNLGAGNDPKPTTSSSDGMSSLNSYFGRVNYGYKGKYLLTATTRIDGSSKFGENSKYGVFPSVGAAWRISKEDFLSNMPTISDLKLRGSWGITGNQEIGNYVTQQYVGNSTIVMGTGTQTGIYPSSVGNPDLKWETTTQWDAGIDLGLFRDRVRLVVDYYHKLTTDMLLSVPLPESTSTGSVLMNYGSVENRGIEIGLTSRNFETSDFTWSTEIMFTSNKNEVIGLGPAGTDMFNELGAGKVTFVTRIGQPIGSFFGLIRLGTWKTTEASEAARYGMVPGDLKFKDKNNDGKIDLMSDGEIIGRSFPKFIAGINNTFTYKGFDAGIDIGIVYGLNKGFIKESA
ncbi:MAG: SusC/RagA family TonB-linked outer membrane protein, partial [Bacteroidales bacterium]